MGTQCGRCSGSLFCLISGEMWHLLCLGPGWGWGGDGCLGPGWGCLASVLVSGLGTVSMACLRISSGSISTIQDHNVN